jgi:1,4-dihydroxy-2-naphthoate octaprenyltransferase
MLSRLPFHTVGLLPFVLGNVIARDQHGVFRWDICIWGSVGVILIMLATYYAGEYWDFKEDSIMSVHKSIFSGGSQVVQRGLLSRTSALAGSIVCAVMAVIVGMVLQYLYGTGPWTLPLGMLGLIGGFFYSSRPVRWVSRGFGEVWIALCYGWLPIAAAYYLQTQNIAPIIHWISIPVGLSIFNVIVLNEFPDHDADRQAGKHNLVVRIGLRKASFVYILLTGLSWLSVAVAWSQGAPALSVLFYIPVFAVSLVVVIMMIRTQWKNRVWLQRLCGATLIVNLGTTAAFIGGYVGT